MICLWIALTLSLAWAYYCTTQWLREKEENALLRHELFQRHNVDLQYTSLTEEI